LAESTSINPKSVQKVEIECKKLKLNWLTVSRESQTKQNGGQLRGSDNILIHSCKENALNKNTLQSTNNWIKV